MRADGPSGRLTVPPSGTAPGLLLRPWAEGDVPALADAHRDPAVRHWLRRPAVTAQDASRIIQARRADWRAGIAFGFAVVRAGLDGRPDPDGPASDLVGGVSIRGLGGTATSGEVGYWVTARWRGRGIAPRLVSTVCEWAFHLPRPWPLEEIKLIHAVDNRASCRVAEKAGFTLSAVLPPLPPEFPGDGHLHVRLA